MAPGSSTSLQLEEPSQEPELGVLRALIREILQSELDGLVQRQPTMSIEQAAQRLGCSERQVFKFLKNGKLDRARRLGRRVRLTADSVEGPLPHEPARPMRQRRPSVRR